MCMSRTVEHLSLLRQCNIACVPVFERAASGGLLRAHRASRTPKTSDGAVSTAFSTTVYIRMDRQVQTQNSNQPTVQHRWSLIQPRSMTVPSTAHHIRRPSPHHEVRRFLCPLNKPTLGAHKLPARYPPTPPPIQPTTGSMIDVSPSVRSTKQGLQFSCQRHAPPPRLIPMQ